MSANSLNKIRFLHSIRLVKLGFKGQVNLLIQVLLVQKLVCKLSKEKMSFTQLA
jgi:hypothetical protein